MRAKLFCMTTTTTLLGDMASSLSSHAPKALAFSEGVRACARRNSFKPEVIRHKAKRCWSAAIHCGVVEKSAPVTLEYPVISR